MPIPRPSLTMRSTRRLQLRVVGDGGADQTDALGRGRNQRQRDLRIEQPHAARRRAPHHAERALPRAAALGLDQEHVGELGVGRRDRTASREQRPGGSRGRGQGLEASRLDLAEDRARQSRDFGQPRLAGSPGPQQVDRLGEERFAVARDQHVDKRQQRARIRRGQRPARDDHRIPWPSVRGEDGDPGALEQAHHAHQLELVRDRQRDDPVVGQRPLRLVGQDRRLGLGPRQRHRLPRIRKKRPVAPAVLVEDPIQRLESQTRHPHPIRAGVGQTNVSGDADPQRPRLGGQPFADH